jgi:hypothetical protein
MSPSDHTFGMLGAKAAEEQAAVGPASHEQARRQHQQSAQGLFMVDVAQELDRARNKFPHTGAVAVALMEEVGELAKAMLDESPERIYREAVQVAAMAARCALEGDPALDSYRQHHQGVDATPARGRRP